VNPLRAYLYRLPLVDGGVREGILLRQSNRWADAAPLPGWSRETLEEVKRCLHGSEDSIPASLRCAREALDEDWIPLRNEVPLNALLDGTADEILAGAVRAFSLGCRCLKIKTSRVDSGRLVNLVRDITRETQGLCQLRLDPNRSWSFEETLRIADQLRDFPIEYFLMPDGVEEANICTVTGMLANSTCPSATDLIIKKLNNRRCNSTHVIRDSLASAPLEN